MRSAERLCYFSGHMKSVSAIVAVVLLSAVVSACSAEAVPPGSCPAVAVSGPDGQPLDLSGTWSGNDGGLYYIKQIDSCVWWSGLSNFVDQGQYPGQEWIMTFRGTINSEGVISGDFVDVKSTNPGSGTMTIEPRIDQVEGVGSVVNLYRTAATGHEIGVTFWRRTTEPAASPTPGESPAPVETGTAPPIDLPTAAPSAT